MKESSTRTSHKHINLDQQGEAYINGSRVKVKQLIFHYRSGVSIEEILEGFPNITAAQFFDALSYYHDHKDQINENLEQDSLETIQEELGVERSSDGTLEIS